MKRKAQARGEAALEPRVVDEVAAVVAVAAALGAHAVAADEGYQAHEQAVLLVVSHRECEVVLLPREVRRA